MVDDFDLVASSLLTQYGIRVNSDTFRQMPWKELKILLAGLGPDTPLGRIVQIRSENDKEVLKKYTKGMHKIRNDYRNKSAKNMNKISYERAMKNFEFMLKSMCE